MTKFQERLQQIKNNLSFQYRDREWEMEEYMNQAIDYANSNKNWTLNDKMGYIENYTQEQLEMTIPEWME